MAKVDEQGVKALGNDVEDNEEMELEEYDENNSEEEYKQFQEERDLDQEAEEEMEDIFNTLEYGTREKDFQRIENQLISKK